MTKSLKLDLIILIDWFRANTLSLNLNKTNYILFRSKNSKVNLDNIELKFGSDVIKRVSHTKFLGLLIDEFLTWNQHVNYICGKLSKSVYLLKKKKNIVPKSSLKLLYHSYTQSVMNYGLLIWGSMCDKTVFNRVVKLQKRQLELLLVPLIIHQLKNFLTD